MALQTGGFSLSALPRSPNVPANIGVVDVKAIYDGVKQGLANFELARQAPQSMLLADAQMQAGTAQAPMKTRQLLAQTQDIEAQTPLKTAILAEEASPEMQAAKRQALLNRGAKAPSGNVQAAIALTNAQRRLAEDPTDEEAALLVANLQPIVTRAGAASLTDPQRVIEERAKAAAADREGRASEGFAQREFEGAEGAANRASRERISGSQAAVRAAIQADKTGAAKAKAATAAKARLVAVESRTNVVERLIEEALPMVGVLTVGFVGNTLSMIPGTNAKDVRRLLDAVKANIGFEELNNLREQSPKGGALGQITERELEFLQAVNGSLQPDQSPSQLKHNLETILERFKELRQERRNAFQQDFGTSTAPAAPTIVAPAAAAAFPTVMSKEQYDALPAGAKYLDSAGNTRTKGGGG